MIGGLSVSDFNTYLAYCSLNSSDIFVGNSDIASSEMSHSQEIFKILRNVYIALALRF